ncbi:uncharacterized protein NPIL_364361 [Nephila pilipes]|uniref:Uncharacterized protein n=1 Tax=Nephila pilipes TaxID=299642 RepID=A0A8X6TWL5_NEPPI|nr:uncharacterized protein NPIL_364361 [Nephila pilipes]
MMTTTKLHFVFNASSETINGTSYNNLQINGGVVQEDLISIMMLFRKHPYPYTADIQKMFSMINIPPKRNLQRIVWKDSDSGPVKSSELSTLIYASIVKEDFNVNDVLCGAKTLPECIKMPQQLTSMLNQAGMFKRRGTHPQLSSTSETLCESSNSEKKL